MTSTYEELCEARTSLSARAIIIVKSHHEIEELKTIIEGLTKELDSVPMSLGMTYGKAYLAAKKILDLT